MGIYVNPDHASFKKAVESQIYIDKSGLIPILNGLLGTEQCYVCVSRARRFGKSVTAGMIKAYYSKGCDSRELFRGLEIEADKSYEKHLNQYDVIHIDMAEMWSNVGKKEELFISSLNQTILEELQKEYSMVDISGCSTMAMALSQINHACNAQFVIIIDEWDTVFREAKQNKKLQEDYINTLRALFKSESAKRFVALAYITGILPIKKYGIESALNNFDEYTMISPKMFAKYYGFTSDEVQRLCAQYGMEFDKMCEWYDGYSFKNAPHIYNPNSVVKAIRFETYESYWSHTEAFSSLSGYISNKEVPFGKGYADFVLMPKKNKDVPAMIVELKCDKSPEEAIAQIKERKYMEGMEEYKGNMLLVGINYDRKTKKHSCMIDEWDR